MHIILRPVCGASPGQSVARTTADYKYSFAHIRKDGKQPANPLLPIELAKMRMFLRRTARRRCRLNVGVKMCNAVCNAMSAEGVMYNVVCEQ